MGTSDRENTRGIVRETKRLARSVYTSKEFNDTRFAEAR